MRRYAIPLIVLAVVGWGIFHAVGAYQFNHNPLRGVVVMVCVAGYLGIWMLLLRVRKAQLDAAAAKRELLAHASKAVEH